MKITHAIFDWGDTIMRDFDFPGPMKDWNHVEYIQGAEEMLSEVSRNLVCCIATSAVHSATDDMIAALRRVGADKFFRNFFSSADIGFTKPDPRFFSAILEHLEVSPSSCIAIGNLYQKDIEPAKHAGCITIFFNEQNQPGDFPAADYIISELSHLPQIVVALT